MSQLPDLGYIGAGDLRGVLERRCHHRPGHHCVEGEREAEELERTTQGPRSATTRRAGPVCKRVGVAGVRGCVRGCAFEQKNVISFSKRFLFLFLGEGRCLLGLPGSIWFG